MVEPLKAASALRALQWVIIRSRVMVQQGDASSAVEDCLDVAEYLTGLLADSTDQTAAFRDQLEGLAGRHSLMQVAVERFDS